jgi:ketosteroid isomerase-like protein
MRFSRCLALFALALTSSPLPLLDATAERRDPAKTRVTTTDKDLADLIQRTAEAGSALIRGDIERYLSLIVHAADYTLMAPLGGATTRGFDPAPEHLARLKRTFRGGTSELEVVQTYASHDLVVLVMIERQRAKVAGLPEQDWSLRVTQVYRRDGAEWHLVHRHADPLVREIGLDHAAAISRGDRR